MTAVEGLVKALKDTKAFLECQKELDCYKTVLGQQVEHWRRRLSSVHITLEEAEAVISQVKETFSQKSVVSKVVAAINSEPDKTPTKQKQVISKFAPYLTKRDVEALEAPISTYGKLDVIACRMIRIGLTHASEPSYGMILEHLGLAQ